MHSPKLSTVAEPCTIWARGPDLNTCLPNTYRQAVLEELVSDGVLTVFQAGWLAQNWAELPDDWASHPFCRRIREHTCAYIDRLRREARSTPPMH